MSTYKALYTYIGVLGVTDFGLLLVLHRDLIPWNEDS